jgi:hypothetical protein
MTVSIFRKPDVYYNVFIQRRREAVARLRRARRRFLTRRTVARAIGMEYYTYLQHCNEVQMLLK